MSTHPKISLSQLKTGKEILNQLMALRRNLSFYPSNHTIVAESAALLLRMLKDVWEEQQKITFTIFGNEFYFQEKLLIVQSAPLEEFKVALQERGVNNITIRKGVTSKELISFAELSCLDRSSFLKTPFNEQLKRMGVENISTLTALSSLLTEIPGEIKVEFKEALKNLHFSTIETIKKAMKACKSNQSLNIQEIRNIVNSIIEMSKVNQPALLILTAIKSYDEYTYYHSVNTCILSLAIGMKLELADQPLNILGCAALLHDIGKIFIPQEVLNKVEPLTEAEKEILNKHSLRGAQVLVGLPHPYKYSAIVALEHHIRYDGQKDIDGSYGETSHMFSRIVQIADVYDAGASWRPYKRPWLPAQSVRYLLLKCGTLFDPYLTKIFVEIIGLYPIGSLVEMNTKELALVIELNKQNMERPKVRVIKDEKNRNIEPFDVDLSQDKSRKIVNFLNPLEWGIDIMRYI